MGDDAHGCASAASWCHSGGAPHMDVMASGSRASGSRVCGQAGIQVLVVSFLVILGLDPGIHVFIFFLCHSRPRSGIQVFSFSFFLFDFLLLSIIIILITGQKRINLRTRYHKYFKRVLKIIKFEV